MCGGCVARSILAEGFQLPRTGIGAAHMVIRKDGGPVTPQFWASSARESMTKLGLPEDDPLYIEASAKLDRLLGEL